MGIVLTGGAMQHIKPGKHNRLNHEIEGYPILPQSALVSIDITDLYTNVPVTETREVIAKALENDIPNPQTRDELINWYDTTTKQNYFSSNWKIMILKEGLAMGAPTSGLRAEFFLQNLENIHLAHLTEKHKIAGYFRYIDDILLIHDPDHTSIQDITNDFKSLYPNLKFTTELQTNNKLNHLDITIHRTPTGWKTSIYRKPTLTDSIIPYSSNHPAQHKYAVIRYLYNRLHTYNVHDHVYRTEENTIHNIMFNNAFPITPKTHPI